ncbi:MAG: hypothetical protein JWO07_284, partial [Candidatus Saccharibacteria bacterium]|nr:hypothetical protein [Candidatus Saccharibacteria bacterium]
GIVTFKDGAQTIGSSAVINGSASIITPLLGVGNHMINATFSPTDPSRYDSVTASLSYQITANKGFLPF